MYINMSGDGEKVGALLYVDEYATEDMIEYDGEKPELDYPGDPEDYRAILKYNQVKGLYYTYEKIEE